MTDVERDNLLLDLRRGQEELFKGQEALFKGQEERDKILLYLKKGQDDLFKGQDETNKELRKLSQTVAKIEHEHGEKIQALLDAVASYPEKFDSIENRLESIETKLDKHSDQIYCINSKVQAF